MMTSCHGRDFCITGLLWRGPPGIDDFPSQIPVMWCFDMFLPEASFGLRVLSLPVSVCVCQLLACPHDNSSPVQARITKVGPDKQNTLVKIPIVLGGNWPWPSRSNLTSNSKYTPFWACPNHYSPPILFRISSHLDCFTVWLFHNTTMLCHILI